MKSAPLIFLENIILILLCLLVRNTVAREKAATSLNTAKIKLYSTRKIRVADINHRSASNTYAQTRKPAGRVRFALKSKRM